MWEIDKFKEESQMFDLNDYFRANSDKRKQLGVYPRIVCKNGISLSVQAGEKVYSSPRSESLHYLQVEVGFPSQQIDKLMEYVELNGSEISPKYFTVYPFVPVELVEEIIDDFGGIK